VKHWPILKVTVTLSIRGEWNRMNIGSFLMRPKVRKCLTALSTCVTLYSQMVTIPATRF